MGEFPFSFKDICKWLVLNSFSSVFNAHLGHDHSLVGSLLICVKTAGEEYDFRLNDIMWVTLSCALPLKMMVVQRPACLQSRQDQNPSDN